ncbi:hypothetical protein ETAA8_01690 [Anatilimnocola aggregata]|uniref:Uncharacterized protein n=1 Tax=Anatilimnocola aggregata TaxID=2528021 RepID=A0A517Y4C9_9BACT|nr:hypothetical protein [Anatilimnocola aggregata]QDU25108.1 hypothetical protein ETAA8_01690 [Anatilimnocola aggregata]
MFRNIAGVVLGLMVAMGLVLVIELVGMTIVPPPEGIMSVDKVKQQAAFAELTPASFAFVLAAWTVGSFGGSLVAALTCASRRMVLAGIIAAFLWFAALVNLISIPSPVWFWVAGLTLIPLAWWLAVQVALIIRPNRPRGPQPFDMRAKNMACK